MPIATITYKNHTFRYKEKGNGLNRFVLTVVRDYVNQHKPITFNQLKLVFPDSLQNNTARRETVPLGVFATFERAEAIRSKDRWRYFSDAHIALLDGVIVVTGEWASEGSRCNLPRFIEKVQELGESLQVHYREPVAKTTLA